MCQTIHRTNGRVKSKLDRLLQDDGCVLRIIHIHWCDLVVVRLERGKKLVGYSETGDALTDIARAVNGSIGKPDPESLKALNRSTTNGKGVQVGFNPKTRVFIAQTTGFFGQAVIEAEDPDSPWKAIGKACKEAQQQPK